MRRRGCLLALALGVVPAPLRAAPVRIIGLHQLRATMRRSRGRVLVLHFWASWCGPCLPRLAQMGRLAREWRARGVALVSLSLDEASAHGAASVARTLAERGVEGLDPSILELDNPDAVIGQVDPRWDGSIPALFVYDRRGKLRESFDEHREVTPEAFVAAVGGLVAVKK